MLIQNQHKIVDTGHYRAEIREDGVLIATFKGLEDDHYSTGLELKPWLEEHWGNLPYGYRVNDFDHLILLKVWKRGVGVAINRVVVFAYITKVEYELRSLHTEARSVSY